METKHIELYGAASPNVFKIFLLLEALNLPYDYHVVDIKQGNHYTEEFKKVNPNSKVPALVDHSAPGGKPLIVFESGNILLYLATKYGNGKFVPNPTTDIHGYTETLNWLFWQMAGLGPNFGQYYHFSYFATEKIEYATKRFFNELRRLFHVLDTQVENNQFVAGNQFSIADMAIYPWAKFIKLVPDFTAEEFPNVYKYLDRVRAIPSVDKVMTPIEEEQKKNPPKLPTDEERKWMFGVDGRENKNVVN